MTISEISIRRPVFAWMLMASLLIFGWLYFRQMGVSQLPDVDFPVVNVSVSLEGAAPEVMEIDVVDPLESAILSVEGVKNLSSTAKSGNANVTVEFELGRNIDVAVQEIQTRLAQAQRQLPKEIDPPIVTKSNPEDQPILWLGVSSTTMEPRELMAFVRDQIKDRFVTLPGVADVFLGGYVEPNLRVWVSQKKLDQYSLTVNDVIGAIQREHAEPPSGKIENVRNEYNLRTMGEALTVDEFKRLTINRRGGAPNYTPIPLSAVARVEEGLADVRRLSRIMGTPSVGLGVRKQRGSNSVAVAHGVKARLAEVAKTLPPGTSIGINFDNSKFIEEAINELGFTLILAAILTALVCWLFLGSWSATVNVIMAIPVSVVGSFIVLGALNFTLNTFTLLGLSLAIGIVVDDAIMVLENIVRHKEAGKSRLEAALIGSREITFAAIAATFAIIAIFLPVAFMKGVVGKYFLQFGVTISVAVIFSLIEALTLTPMRCSQFLEVGERTTRVGRWIDALFARSAAAYGRLIPRLLEHRWKTIGVTLLVFALSLFSLRFIRKEFVPAQDQSSALIRLKTPEGSSITFTDAKTRELEAIIQARPEVERSFVSVGGFGGGDVNTAVAFVTLKPRNQRALSQQELLVQLREDVKKIQGARIVVQDLSLGGFASGGRGFPIEYSIQGPEWEVLTRTARNVMEAMEKTGKVADVDSDFREGVEEIQIIPDRDRARARGVSVADIGQTISALISGSVVGKFSKGGHRFDIRVKIDPAAGINEETIKKVHVQNNRGELIPLSEVVTVIRKASLQQITRKNRERAITVYANVAAKVSQAEALAETEKVAREIVPAGYRLIPTGSAETFRESMSSLVFALVMGLIVSYMVLASQFNSFRDPITVLMALPFSLTGALFALLVTGQSINIYSMIGVILLMGIVKKNSILLVDYTNQMREQEPDPKRALQLACPVRLRPILMTSFATIAGALPAALALGPGAETRTPMAIAVMGGTLFSTVLTLFAVPCAYSLLSRRQKTVN